MLSEVQPEKALTNVRKNIVVESMAMVSILDGAPYSIDNAGIRTYYFSAPVPE